MCVCACECECVWRADSSPWSNKRQFESNMDWVRVYFLSCTCLHLTALHSEQGRRLHFVLHMELFLPLMTLKCEQYGNDLRGSMICKLKQTKNTGGKRGALIPVQAHIMIPFHLCLLNKGHFLLNQCDSKWDPMHQCRSAHQRRMKNQ